jgi:hypothetical protein
MPIKFARRTLLQTGLIAAGVAVSGTLLIAQHASARLSTHALDTYLGKGVITCRVGLIVMDGG